jgi:hypothetical protein
VIMGGGAILLGGPQIALSLVTGIALACVPERWMQRRQGGRAPARRRWTPSSSTLISPTWSVMGAVTKEHYAVAVMALLLLVIRFGAGFPARHVPQVAMMSLATAALLPRWTIKAHAAAVLARLPVAPNTLRDTAIAKGLVHGASLGLTLFGILVLSDAQALGITSVTSVLVLVALATTSQIAGVAAESDLSKFMLVVPSSAFVAIVGLVWKADPWVTASIHLATAGVTAAFGASLTVSAWYRKEWAGRAGTSHAWP